MLDGSKNGRKTLVKEKDPTWVIRGPIVGGHSALGRETDGATQERRSHRKQKLILQNWSERGKTTFEGESAPGRCRRREPEKTQIDRHCAMKVRISKPNADQDGVVGGHQKNNAAL